MEPDEYQEQEDNMNVNTPTWRDGNGGGFSNPMGEGESEQVNRRNMRAGNLSTPITEKKPKFSIEDYEKQLAFYDNPEGVFEESYDLIKSCRGIDEDGIVVNPGFGDEWGEMKLRDEKNDRTLIVGFKAYLQVPQK